MLGTIRGFSKGVSEIVNRQQITFVSSLTHEKGSWLSLLQNTQYTYLHEFVHTYMNFSG